MKKRELVLVETLKKVKDLREKGYEGYAEKVRDSLTVKRNMIEFSSWDKSLERAFNLIWDCIDNDAPIDYLETYLIDCMYVEEADLIDADKSGIMETDPDYFFTTRGYVYAYGEVLAILQSVREKWTLKSWDLITTLETIGQSELPL
ncbi:hypothetical protein KI809_19505 [Geobacter pelophilus]|uniref:Uncharacterized protein n=1 Tax=Geoanaerobacter pelophilus TaxID=60036 RepID=A0AAW4LDI7_9BACT|nr:hypothetical protein [Geoanaerobacter pelophilus]MBT0666501.1 hypothetical protein [Geoanaerobacter pelophilus]